VSGAAPIVTVDGPAGSGKTTLGLRLAQALGLPLIDTGLFYRAVTVAALRAGLGAGDGEAIGRLAGELCIEVNTSAGDRSWEVRLDGEDLGEAIRDPRHAVLLSRVSQVPAVRRMLLPLQRAPAGRGAVAVGRDCGTVVFPQALVKLYLQATEALRSSRRRAELAGRGRVVDGGTLDAEVARRDRGDAPSLAPAPDALVIDTGSAGIDEMVRIALARCAEAGLVPVLDGRGAHP
jgi:cytidylate kinase